MISNCPECGFKYDDVSPADASAAVRSFERRYRAPLTRFLAGEDAGAVLRHRPAEGTWSALEYAAHVRNSFQLARRSIERVMSEDAAHFPPVDPDEEARRLRFNDQDPEAVADGIATATAELAMVIESVPPEGWGRTATVAGLGEVDALWFARNAVHEGHHHLLDVGRVLRAARQGGHP